MTTRAEKSARVFCWRDIAVTLVIASFAVASNAQAPAASGDAPPPAATPEQLEKLVGPIALYPDDLVAIILPASTSPLQLVQADRYLDKRKADPKLPIDDKMDDAVKSLLNYPEVLKEMSGDLDWTVDLGEAVVADQGAVLDAIQAFRRKSQAAGNLKTDDKQVIVVEKEVVKIVPANPEVIYVPQYNPSSVVVYSSVPVWGYYPAPYPSYYYPYAPGAALATGLIWGAAIGAAWNGGHWNTNWGGGNNNITINRGGNTINTGNINTGNINRGGASASQRPANSQAWKSNKTPGQVSGSTGRAPSTGRVGDGGGRGGDSQFGGGGRGGDSQFGGGGRGGDSQFGGGRASTQPAGGGGRGGDSQFGGGAGAGARDRSAGGGAGGGRDAFGSYGGSGRQASMDSSRGASSRSSMAGGGGGGRSASAGAASRGGGGMSGASRGGGGARAGGGGRGGGRR